MRMDPTWWDHYEATLRDHMRTQEQLLIPAYQRDDPEAADELRSEHAQIRALLDDIHEHVHRHGVHAARLRRLDTLLSAHRQHEDATLHAWAKHHAALVARRRLRLRAGDWLAHLLRTSPRTPVARRL